MGERQDTSYELKQVLEAELAEINRIRELRRQRNQAKKEKLTFETGSKRQAAVERAPAGRDSGAPAAKYPVEQNDERWVNAVTAAHDANLTALCFSGGGIRSATFNLGVLQALAELKLLHRLDYLSTVSGGGYIGGWLAAWTSRSKSFADVQDRLGHSRVNQTENKEPSEIRFLRMFSNYLTPKIGGLSADTWAMVSVYTRNMLLNLVVLLAVLSALMLVPHVALGVLNLTPDSRFRWIPWAVFGLACILFACVITFLNMAFIDKDSVKTTEWFTAPTRVYLLVCTPLLVFALSGALWAKRSLGAFDGWTWTKLGAGTFGGVWLLSLLAATGIGLIVSAIRDLSKGTPAGANAANEQNPATAAPVKVLSKEWWTSVRAKIPVAARASGKWIWRFCVTVVSAAAAGAFTGWLYSCAAKWMVSWRNASVLAFGMPVMILLLLICGTLHIGLMGIVFREAKREWWARAAGLMMLTGVSWTTLFSMALLFPTFVSSGSLGKVWGVVLSWKILTPAWLATTIGGVLSSKSTATGAPGSEGWRDVLAKVAPYVFIAGLLCWIAWTIEVILRSCDKSLDCLSPMLRISDPDLRLTIAMLVVCILVAALLSWRVDINQFSMHMFYRNRLVRCYLGASNEQRKPNLFTGFCDNDDVALKDLISNPTKTASDDSQCKQPPPPAGTPPSLIVNLTDGYDGPYPVLNASLNLVKGQDLAWQERKAESFVMTPQFCGYDVWLEEQDSPVSVIERKKSTTEKDGKQMTTDSLDRYGLRPTTCYAFPPPLFGVKLGLAMAISGAAVSPSMGFYTTPPVGFLMTVFDVRLGQWLGNPRHPKTWTRPTPRFGLAYLLKELLGGTDDNAAYVYLSDGGHFENMGLYEMVKRRCGLVIVCDAEADGDYTFAGIGNAIRKCRVDLGVDIQLDIGKIVPGKRTNLSKAHCAVGTIHYENADPNAPTGTIIYVKASLAGDEPTDVKNYSKTCPAFPHESTVDQWFTETQFESYRALGYHIISSSFRTPATGIAPPAANASAQPGREATQPAAPAPPPKLPEPVTLEIRVGETPVPLKFSLASPLLAAPPAEASGPFTALATAPPAVPTSPGPGSIPLDPESWRKAALAAEQPLYVRVQQALGKFGFDTSHLSLIEPAAETLTPKPGLST